MAYDGYASYAADYDYGYGYGSYSGPTTSDPAAVNALSELAGSNSTAYERSDSPGVGTQTSYAVEDADGNVYYRNTATDSYGYYSSYSGSFASNGGYYGSAYYGFRYSSFSYSNGPGGNGAPALYAESQLNGPGSSAYDLTSSPQFGTATDYAVESTDGALYQRETLSYGPSVNDLTQTSYTSASHDFESDLKTYSRSGAAFNYYTGSTSVDRYQSAYSSSLTNGASTADHFSNYAYSIYQNGSHSASVYDVTAMFENGKPTGSTSYHYSIYTNSYGASYPNGYYGMS